MPSWSAARAWTRLRRARPASTGRQPAADVALPQPGRVHGLPQPGRQLRPRPEHLADEQGPRLRRRGRQPAPDAGAPRRLQGRRRGAPPGGPPAPALGSRGRSATLIRHPLGGLTGLLPRAAEPVRGVGAAGRPLVDAAGPAWDKVGRSLERLEKGPGAQPTAVGHRLSKRPRAMRAAGRPLDSRADLNARARSYLHANCAAVPRRGRRRQRQRCDLEFATRADKDEGRSTCKPLHDTFDLPDAKLIAPGQPERSVLLAPARSSAARARCRRWRPLGSTPRGWNCFENGSSPCRRRNQ